MTFDLAVAGLLPDDLNIKRIINELFGRIKAFSTDEKSDEPFKINMLISPEYTDPAWREHAELGDYDMRGYALLSNADQLSGCAHSVALDGSLRSIAGECMCNNADLLLAVWNEDVLEMDGAVWEIIQIARQTKLPCVWISSKDPEGTKYWAADSPFEKYREKRLRLICKDLMAPPVSAELSDADKSELPLLISLGEKLQNHFLKKHKAQTSKFPPATDVLLTDEYVPDSSMPESADIRRALFDGYNKYNDAAEKYASKYRAVMYWRAILPFIATAFLAVGFYAGTVLDALFPISTATFKPFEILAGFGFLIHGLLNLYSYVLSKNKTVQGWHSGFLNTRYTAEILRVLIHFEPYGISVNLRKLAGGNKSIYSTVHGILNETQNVSIVLNRKSSAVYLKHANEFIDDQVRYQDLSEKKYASIINSLSKWHKWIFGIGFALIILRALLQFYLGFQTPAPNTAQDMSYLGMVLTKIRTKSFISSFANMIALMVPAWASYFMSKLEQCSYRYNYENHKEMKQALLAEKEKLANLSSPSGSIAPEALITTAESLAETMLVGDTNEWHSKMSRAKITQI